VTTQSSKLYRREKPLRDIVGDHIRAGIYDGTFPPGARLVEQELAESLTVSRLPVREALRVLTIEGLVEHLPTRGVVVRTLDRKQVVEIYDIREALEVLAARQAAERVAAGVESDLSDTMGEAQDALGEGDAAAVHAANSRLHDEIIALSGNALLAEMLESVVGRVAWLRRKIEDFEVIRVEHEALTAAILAGDPESAASAARDHVLASRARTVEILFGA
jgi:DNA-binding GntR family transcriptional regulator